MIRMLAALAVLALSACGDLPTPNISQTAENVARDRLAAQCQRFHEVASAIDARIDATPGAGMDLTLLLDYDQVASVTSDICVRIAETAQPGFDAGIVERNIEQIEEIGEEMFLEPSTVS